MDEILEDTTSMPPAGASIPPAAAFMHPALLVVEAHSLTSGIEGRSDADAKNDVDAAEEEDEEDPPVRKELAPRKLSLPTSPPKEWTNRSLASPVPSGLWWMPAMSAAEEEEEEEEGEGDEANNPPSAVDAMGTRDGWGGRRGDSSKSIASILIAASWEEEGESGEVEESEAKEEEEA